MYVAIAVAVSLLTADRVLRHLSRTGKLRYEGRLLRLTHLENHGFFMSLGQQHPRLVRWMPWAVWLLAAVCLLPQLSKRAFAAQLGISLVLSMMDKTKDNEDFVARFDNWAKLMSGGRG